MTTQRRHKTEAICNLMKVKGLTLAEAFEETDKRKQELLRNNLFIKTDEEILDIQLGLFEKAGIYTKEMIRGIHNSLIVSGDGGIGKTYSIDKVIEQYEGDFKFYSLKGATTPQGLYTELYENRFKNTIIVIDDCDDVFSNTKSINILKAALDSKPTRIVQWKSSRQIKTYDGEVIPQKFLFEASVVFLTNIDIAKKGKDNKHISALISRSINIDFYEIFKTKRDWRIRLNYLTPFILKYQKVNAKNQEIILDYVEKNSDKFKDISMRAIGHIIGITKHEGYKGYNVAYLEKMGEGIITNSA